MLAAGQQNTMPDWGPRGGGRRGRAGGGRFGGLDPVTHYSNKPSIDSIIDFFGMKPSLALHRQLVARSPPDMEKPKRLYFVSGGVRDLLQVDEHEQLKVTACGLKVLERQEFKVSFFPDCCRDSPRPSYLLLYLVDIGDCLSEMKLPAINMQKS